MPRRAARCKHLAMTACREAQAPGKVARCQLGAELWSGLGLVLAWPGLGAGAGAGAAAAAVVVMVARYCTLGRHGRRGTASHPDAVAAAPRMVV